MVRRFQTAAIGAIPPAPDLLVEDPVIVARTIFNQDRTHRFTLFRYWGDIDDFVVGISMNPSGADESVSDRTVSGMVDRARLVWKVGAYYQLNAMSVRLTDSKDLKRVEKTNLPENDDYIRLLAPKARFVVVSWGNPGHECGRGPEVERILLEVCDPNKILCFGKTKSGAPLHPLYQKRHAALIPYFS
jgi:hypothetical protein